ncbi:MAG: ferritin-like domain-containing protein [Pseudomonadota bacterium]
MSVDPRMLGWLSRALTHELGALQQYLAQSALARLWGDTALADALRHEALEELAHAERLMERLIVLGRAPAAGSLAPARLGRDAQALWDADRQLEIDAVLLYREALAHAQRVRDGDSAALLHELLQAEAAHLQGIDRHLGEASRHD